MKVWRASSPRRDSVGAAAAPQRVQAPRPGDGDVEKEQAIEDGAVAAVDDREETVRRVAEEIGKGHLARHDESRGAREQAERDQGAAGELDHAGEPMQGEQRLEGLRREPDHARAAVLEEQQRHDDADDGQYVRRVTRGGRRQRRGLRRAGSFDAKQSWSRLWLAPGCGIAKALHPSRAHITIA
jgi:hypothetical protein